MRNFSTTLFRKTISLIIVLLGAFSISANAQCRLLNEPFNVNPVLSPTNVDGTWYPDRYRPAGFVSDVLGGGNVLKISIDGPGDGLASRPPAYQSTFYNTQGRKFNQCGGCVTVSKADIWIPANWATNHRRSDMWATAYDNTNTVSVYPIIGFRNPDGASPGLYYWDENIGWVNTGVAIVYNSWYTLEFRLVGSNIEYYVNGAFIVSITSNSSTYLGDIIMQAYNFNDPTLPLINQSADSYDAYWDNLITTGTGGKVVTNINTGQTFCSIQTAIDAPLTVAGNTLSVGAGTYTENVNISKSLTIRGPNTGIAGNGARVTEAIIDGNITGAGFVVDYVNDVTIDGFKVINGADGFNCGVSFGNGNNNNLKILNNIITGNHIGIGGFPGSACEIKNNLIDDNNVDGPIPAATGVGIYLESSTGLAIENNEIKNQSSNAVLFAATAAAAHTNLLFTKNNVHNNDANVYSVSVATGTFTQNSLDQQNATCLSFAGGCTDITVTNNFFNGNLRGLRVDDQGYGFGDNSNIVVNNNSFTGTYSGFALGVLSGYATILNAECNWWNSTNGSVIAAKITGTVDYIPWLISGVDAAPGTPGFQPSVPCTACTLAATITSTQATCPTLANGTATVTVTPGSGTGPYTYAWNTVPVQTTPTATGLNANLYNVTITDINGCNIMKSVTVTNNPAGPVHNTNTGLNYCSIQAAISAPATLNGHTITVDPGMYAENIIVSKSLTILGPNSGINPCTGGRGAEAIVVPASSGIDFLEIFHVAASNVTISGFTIDGDNPAITSGFISTNGADIDAAEGVTDYETGVNNLTVTNNIIKNLSYTGVTLFDYISGVPTSGHVISNNKIQDLGTYDPLSTIDYWGIGVLLYNNQYAAVTNNCMSNVRLGVQTGNFYLANPGAAANISNNTIGVRRRGIFHNLSYSTASPFTLNANTITGVADANETASWDGILLSSMQSTASTASANIINGAAIVSIPTTGISVWNCQVAPLISGGTISGVGLGINVNNYEGYPSTGSNADNTSATIDGVTVTGATIAGIQVHDNPLNSNGATVFAEIKHSSITGGAAGILVSGSDAGANIHNNPSTITGAVIGVDVDGGTATVYQNNITANGTGVRVINGGNLTPTTENFITANTVDGIRIEANAGTIGGINYNDLSGNAGKAIRDLKAAPTVNGTCNWYGTTNSVIVASKVAGNVNYVPWLLNGTDNLPGTPGFQAVPGSCTGGIPKLSTTINGVTVNSDNDGNDDLAAFNVCTYPNNIVFNSYTDQNGLNDPLLKVYQTLTTVNVTVPFCNNCSATMAAFTGASGTASLINPSQQGTLVMRFKAWVDLNNDGNVDPSEPQGDWIQYTMTIYPRPIFTSTLNGITLTNNNDGIDETASMVICNSAGNNLHFTGVMDLQGVVPATSVKMIQTTVRTNVTFNGAADGVYVFPSVPATFDRNLSLINPSLNGTFVIRRQLFFDINNNNVLDAGECANDWIQYTVTVDATAPVLTGVLPGGAVGNVCQANAPAAPSTALIASKYTDLQTVTATLINTTSSGNNCSWSVTYTYSVVDACNNAAANAVVTYTGGDTQAPTFVGPLPGGAVGNVCQANAPAAPTVATIASKYTDNCSGVIATLISTVPSGNNCAWSVTYTYTVKDACNNAAANAVVTYTGGDTQAPTFVGPLPGGAVGNVCQANAPAAPTVATIASKYTDNCSGVIATLISTVPSGNNCAWSVTYTYTIKDGCNNAAANAVVTYTGGDTQAPTLTGVLPGGAVGSVCKANAPAAPTVATIASKYTDNCSGVVVVQIGSSVTGTNCSWTATYTYSVKDACNNAAANAVVVYTGGDVTPPTFTRPADITILFISPGVYDASPAVTGDVTNEADNCGVGQATYTDAVAVQCGNNLIITRTWHLVDNCSNAAANQVQTITVTDNNSPYVIYAQKEAKFGEDNIINGDVGVTDANGKAEFKKNDVLDPYHVYAKNITVQMPATVNNKHFVPATGGPNPPFQLYVANPLSGNYTQSVNGVVPAGNYKNLTIKKNVVATVNGSNYGKITIEEGAIVTFTSSNMNIEELSVGKGKKGIALTTVIFTNSAAVKIKDRVTIEEDCRINIGGPKVTFYLGDSKKDEENFMVKGDDTQITLNIMIPNGKLKIEKKSDDCIMTGWFIIEKLESTGSTTWNGYGCVPPLAMPVTSRGGVSEAKEVKQTPVVAKQEAFAVTVSPNPSASVFSIRIAGSSDEPVMIRVLDLSGKVMEIKTGMSKGSTVTVGARLIGGSYFAEVTQGSNRKVVKLLKLN